jgi:hypothetical protein
MPTVLCIGDEHVVGNDGVSSSYRTFRGTLQTLLSSAGILSLDFIGPNSLAPANEGGDPDHAGYAGAFIDSTGGTLNVNAQLASLKTAYPSPDLIVLYVGWKDVISAPGTIGTRYSTLLGNVQSGAWASKKVICCTLHPAPGQTEVQTGSTYAAYATLNAQIRSLCAAAPTTRILADLAALTGANQAAFVERIIYRVQTVPAARTAFGGGTLPNWAGGHRVTSFKSILDYNAQWSTNPPAAGTGNNGGTAGLNPNLTSVVNGVNLFTTNVQCCVQWAWAFCAPGHASTNTCIEIRNVFAQAKHATRGWEFFYEGARLGTGSVNISAAGTPFGSPRLGQRADGLTTWICPDGSRGIELWPADTNPSRGIVGFYGARNRDLMATAQCFVLGFQARLAKIDPNGPDDRAAARFVITTGADFAREYASDEDRYDRYGWPYTVMDGGSDLWEPLTATDWIAITAATIGRGGAGGTAANSHWEDPATPPPLSPYAEATPYNDLLTYSLSTDNLRSVPPLVPSFWEASGGTGSGYADVDYLLNTTTGLREITLLQSGADKVAGVMSRAIAASGALSGVFFSPMPGLPLKPNVFTKITGGTNANVEPKEWDTSAAPTWSTTLLAPATIGVAYTGQLSARGSPTPTYTIISGAPGWLSCSSSGALTGTPTGSATTHAIIFRATNSVGTADVTLTLQVAAGVTVTTTTLPSAEENAAYLQALAATGTGPLTWSLASGTLNTGLTLSASSGVISGTPTALGLSSFTVRATGPTGLFDDQALSITVVAAGNAPVITSTSLADGTQGVAYSQTIAATGATPRTWSVVAGALPPGLALNASTGAITGTPTVPGGYPFTVRLSNAVGAVELQLSIRVLASGTTTATSPWTAILKGR